MTDTAPKKPIGVFDSGFGGISILKEIVATLPDYDYAYLGDTARTPYGTRPPEEVYRFTLEAIEFLFGHGSDLVLLACNTTSAEALRKLQQEYLPVQHPNKRVLGVIVPAIEEASIMTKNKRIGVLATTGTVASGTFTIELKKLDSTLEVFEQAAPLLVPFVEDGEHHSDAAKVALKEYLEPLLAQGIDTLILGCTHYGHMEEEIRAIIGPNIRIVSEGPIVARKLAEYLTRHPELESGITRTGSVDFYTTDSTDRFRSAGGAFFGKPIEPKHVTLGAV